MLKSAWKRWLKVAKVIGNFQGQVILTLFYFVLVAPFGFVLAFFGDPLKMKKGSAKGSNFGNWNHKADDLESARRQY